MDAHPLTSSAQGKSLLEVIVFDFVFYCFYLVSFANYVYLWSLLVYFLFKFCYFS